MSLLKRLRFGPPTLTFRLMATFALFVAAFAAATVLVNGLAGQQRLSDSIGERIDRTAAALARLPDPVGAKADDLAIIAAAAGVVTIEVVAASDAMPDLAAEAQAFGGRVRLRSGERLEVAWPASTLSGSPVYVVGLAPPASTGWRSSLTVNGSLALAFLGLAIPLSRRLVGRATRPIRDLTAAVLTGRVDFAAIDRAAGSSIEFRALAVAFKRNCDRLARSLRRINQLAYVDAVTGLGNRELLRREMAAELDCETSAGAILYIDLDRFKKVNDTFGHDCGDTLLKAFADRLTDRFGIGRMADVIDGHDCAWGDRRRIVAARIGGDEFVMLLPGVVESDDAERHAERVLEALAAPFAVAGVPIYLGGSIGIARYPLQGRDQATLMRLADIAMYRAKSEGRNRFCHYSKVLDFNRYSTLRLDADLRGALANGEFKLVFQPKHDCRNGDLTGAEALVRWQHPSEGLLGPARFVPLAESNGTIHEIGTWVMTEACSQAVRWASNGRRLPVAVNASMVELERDDFVGAVRFALAASGLDPTLLEIEVTESMASKDPDALARMVLDLKDDGVRFAIDDFGTGFSNLSALSRLPFDVFKIDKSFVAGIGRSRDAEAVIRTILAMAASLGCQSVAEGVETEAQRRFLADNGCVLMQGFLTGEPMPAGDFTARLRAGRADGIRVQRGHDPLQLATA